MPGSAAAADLYPGNVPPAGPGQYPVITPNSYPPQLNTTGPPIINFNTGAGLQRPPSSVPMVPSMGVPPPISYPNMNPMPIMQPQAPFYNPRFASHVSRRPMRVYPRHRSHRFRPVVRIIEEDSCSSTSTCSTISSCSSHHHHRSCSYSRYSIPQQQPIILLPVQCQQQPLPITTPIQGQGQQIILPPTQIKQQSLALPPISKTNSTPVIIQPSILKSQPIQAGPIQYVQATPQTSSSQLQFISVKPSSSVAPQHVLVNSTNKKPSTVIKPIRRSITTGNLPQNDLKFGRRPFNWYSSDGKKYVIKDNIQIGQRGQTRIK